MDYPTVGGQPIPDWTRRAIDAERLRIERERRTDRLLRRAQYMAKDAIGKTLTVRTSKASRGSSGSTVTGRIESCEAAVRSRGQTLIAQWTVVVRRPDNTTTEPLTIEELPR